MIDRVKRLPRNEVGRDFVVGDIHGCYTQLFAELREIGFDPSRDRLLSVGDLVDRGPESLRAREFLAQPWVQAIRGNHEDMWLELYGYGEPSESDLRHGTRHNGMDWWLSIGSRDRSELIGAFRKLPVAIEVDTVHGAVGLVHAEVPTGMTWQEFCERTEDGDRAAVQPALWGRARIAHRDHGGVPGIWRVFVGHTPLSAPDRLGNVFYLDTGAVFGGRLTIVEAGRDELAFDALT